MGRVRYALCVFAIVLLPGCLVTAIVAECLQSSERRFDPERWKNGDARQRARMVRDLNPRRVLIGKTWGEVVALLGPGDRGDWEHPEHLIEFELVHGNLLGLMEWWELLLVRFDPDTGRVSEVTFLD